MPASPSSSAGGGGWREQLGGAVPASTDHARLGLLFQLRRLTRAGSQWTAPKAETATSLHGGGMLRLAVRPVTTSSTGNWVVGELGWGSIGFKIERLDLDPRQVAWFTQFVALHRASGDAFRASEPDWLYLDDFASPLLWPLLAGAVDLGVAFVTGRASLEVRVAAAVAVSVDASAGRSGAVRLTPRARLDGDELEVTGVVSDHGLYSARFDRGLHVTLAPVTPGGAEVLRWEGGGLTIAAADVEEFWTGYYPMLTRRVEVESSELSLPEVHEEPVLIVEFGRRDTVDTRWETWIGSTRIRHPEAPSEALAELDVPDRLTDADAAEFVAARLPELERSGVRVEIVGERPAYRELTDVPKLELTAVPSEHRDWLDLGFLVTVGGREIPFAKLFAALSRGRTKLLMADRTYLSLQQPVFDALRELIEEGAELDEWETGARISRYRATLLEPFEDLADVQPEAIAWRGAAAALRTTPAELPPPDGLAATLRPYQLEGFRWLAHLWGHHLGGVLADDMGLGKTLQTIALMLHATQQRSVSDAAGAPFLVVAPTSVVGNWADELARFAPGLRVATVASTRQPMPHDVDVVLTSYAVFRLRFSTFDRVDWAALVLDEAQFLKNPASQVHESARALRAPVKYALTGTPLENSLMDLWSLFRVVAPGLFASRIGFSDRFIKVQKDERIAELRRRIRPLMLRRTKALVASDLPPKQEQVLAVDLAPAHRALYDRYLQRERQKLLGLVEDLDRHRFAVFRSLTLLRLLALDARLVDGAHVDAPSSKLDALMEQLDDVVAEGHRALVFSQFTSYLSIVRERLDAAGIAYEYLDGSTLRRDEVIARFRGGDAPLFLVSLRAGGFGLTLTEADYVFLLDPWWNPAAETQAIDRTHRIGQTRNVMVYRLVARDTIEEKVLALGDAKRALFDQVVDEGEIFSAALTADDIRGLLG